MILQVGRLQTPNVAAAGQGHRYQGNPLHFAPHGLVALWDASVVSSVTLNGTDVSGLASMVAGGIDLAQVTAANQPLYTGAPTYGSPSGPQPSIAFTAANTDQVVRANTNLSAGDLTVVSAQKIRTTGTTFITFNGDGLGTGVAIGMAAGNRTANKLSISNHTDAAPSTAVPEIWVTSFQAASSVPTMTVDNVAVVLSGAASIKNPTTGAATLMLGNASAGFNIDMDFLAEAWFTSVLPATVGYRITKAWGARFGKAV